MQQMNAESLTIHTSNSDPIQSYSCKTNYGVNINNGYVWRCATTFGISAMFCLCVAIATVEGYIIIAQCSCSQLLNVSIIMQS